MMETFCYGPEELDLGRNVSLPFFQPLRYLFHIRLVATNFLESLWRILCSPELIF